MMDMGSWIRAQEERMMINIFLASINMSEESNVLLSTRLGLIFNAHEVRGYEVEISRVEPDLLVKIFDTAAVVTELMDGSRSVVEPLEGTHASLFVLKVVHELGW
jgi:hypothetical protein